MGYEQDYLIGVIIVVFVVFSLLGMTEFRGLSVPFTRERRNCLKATLFGAGILAFCAAGNSLAEGKWDLSFLFAFFTARKTGDWFFRYLLPVGYLALGYGITGLFMLRSRDKV